MTQPTTATGDPTRVLELLEHARALLTEIETVLVHLSPAAGAEITQILDQHNNSGGHGLLIDQVQLTGLIIEHYLNQ